MSYFGLMEGNERYCCYMKTRRHRYGKAGRIKGIGRSGASREKKEVGLLYMYIRFCVYHSESSLSSEDEGKK